MADGSALILYTTEPCGFCRQAKALLETRGFPYEEVNLAKDPVGRAALVARTGQMTFPQLVVGDRAIGGVPHILPAPRAGLLHQLLAADGGAAQRGGGAPLAAPAWPRRLPE